MPQLPCWWWRMTTVPPLPPQPPPPSPLLPWALPAYTESAGHRSTQPLGPLSSHLGSLLLLPLPPPLPSPVKTNPSMYLISILVRCYSYCSWPSSRYQLITATIYQEIVIQIHCFDVMGFLIILPTTISLHTCIFLISPGEMLLPPLQLPSRASQLFLHGGSLAVLTTDATLTIWDLTKRRRVLSESIRHLGESNSDLRDTEK